MMPEHRLWRIPARVLAKSQMLIEKAMRLAWPWAISFSGGKDSTVLLHLVRQINPHCKAYFIDSGAEFPETLQFVSETSNVLTVHPPMGILDMYQEVGALGSEAVSPNTHWGPDDFLAMLIKVPSETINEDKQWAGNFTGLRADESRSRKNMGQYKAQPWQDSRGIWRCEPLMDWTERDIWAYIAQNNLPYNAVYDKYRSLGMPRTSWRVCTYAGRTSLAQGRWVWLRKGWPQLWARFAQRFPEVRNYS